MMKRIALRLVCPLISALLMTACLGDAVVTASSSTVSLLSFEIKDLKTTHTIQKADGTDSTYTTVLTGSTVKFTIDHANRCVYNTDSIAYGTDVARVLVSVTADGYVYYLKENGDAASIEDSIDFRSPVTFQVKSYDEQFVRNYTVSVNVHQVDPKKTAWRQVADTNFPANWLVEHKSFIKDDRLIVWGKDAEGAYHTASAALADVSVWEVASCIGLEGTADAVSAMLVSDAFYMTTNAGLYRSTDAIAWTLVDPSMASLILLAVEDSIAWGVGTDGFVSSSDMTVWNAVGQQPAKAIGCGVASFSHSLRTNDKIKRTIFVALPEAADTCAQVWSKLSTEKDWVQVEPKGDNIYGCPNLKNLAVISYAGNMYAFGGESVGNRKVKLAPFSTCYESRDNGVTWKENEGSFSLPKEIKGRFEDSFSAVTDGEYVWMVWSSGEVWRGRWNGL